MLGTPTQCHTFGKYVDSSLKTRLIKSILFDNSKHHFNNFNSFLKNFDWLLHTPSKILIGSCTHLNVDSGSCSCWNLNYWLRLLPRPKIQTPAGVHSGTPAAWSSLMCVPRGHFQRGIIFIGGPDGSISLEYCLVLWRNNYYTCARTSEQR